jgi:aspartyl protease family protein
MRLVLIVAAVALAAAVVVPRYAAQMNVSHAAPTVMAARPEASSPSASGNSVIIPPGRGGHFEVEGHVDGRRLDFMVDTGASVIALTERDAATLGIHPAERDYTATVRTANGNARAAPVELNRVEIDNIVVRNVAALVLPNSALSDNLLGLSFLQRLRRFEYADGKLVLEQ